MATYQYSVTKNIFYFIANHIQQAHIFNVAYIAYDYVAYTYFQSNDQQYKYPKRVTALVKEVPGLRFELITFPCHDDVIKWQHFPRYWTFVRGIHRGPVNSPHKG